MQKKVTSFLDCNKAILTTCKKKAIRPKLHFLLIQPNTNNLVDNTLSHYKLWTNYRLVCSTVKRILIY